LEVGGVEGEALGVAEDEAKVEEGPEGIGVVAVEGFLDALEDGEGGVVVRVAEVEAVEEVGGGGTEVGGQHLWAPGTGFGRRRSPLYE
jgi:hypothetical protein